MDLESLDILQEICTVNGVHFENLNEENFLNHTLYIIFSGLPKWISLQSFPFLTELIIISQGINHIAKLETCPNLKKLWLCECKLLKIENLSSCKQLSELYLYENHIKKIENLSGNQKLECLWLNENRISIIEGLQDLKLLKHLNLSGNNIVNLNDSLLFNQKLEILSLSGNQLWNPNDIAILAKLPHLTSLNINEPEYLKNPLCNNVNLPMILIYQLPRLCNIDHININYTELKYAINTIIQGKKSYYMMKCQNYQTLHEKTLISLKLLFNKLQNKLFAHIKLLDKTLRCLQAIERQQLKIEPSYEMNTLLHGINTFNERIPYWENIHCACKLKYNILCNQLKEHLQFRQHLYELELEMFGYLEIQEITVKEDLFTDCNEFLNARFCCHNNNNDDEIGSIMISGVKLLHLYKINNRIFHHQHHHHHHQNNNNHNRKHSIQNAELSMSNLIVKCSTFSDYLFIVCPEKVDQFKAYMNIIRYGVRMNNNQYKLTNIINMADEKNLQTMHQPISEVNLDQYNNYVARLLLVKSSLSNDHNVITTTNNNSSNDKKDQRHVEHVAYYEEKQSSCFCLSQIKRPNLLLDSELIYPEFLVELEYILKNDEYAAIFDQVDKTLNFEIDNNNNNNLHILFDEDIQYDQNLLKTFTLSSSSSTSPSSTTTSTTSMAGDQSKFTNFKQISTSSIHFFSPDKTSLFLNDIEFSRKFEFPGFSNLCYLSITHCQLKKLPLLHCNNLTSLIISHNQFDSLKSFGCMPNLTELQVDYNQLTNVIDNVAVLVSCTPKLENLSWRANPWKIIDKLVRIYTLTKLPHLKSYNFQSVHEEATETASHLLDTSCIITSSMIQSQHNNSCNSNNNRQQTNDFYQNLTIFPIAYYHKLLYDTIDACITTNCNFHSITSLCLQSLNLLKIENLEQLPNLKYLSLNHNYITKIEGLNNCFKLIELSLEFNCIQSIENINHLKNLQCLLLSNNHITRIDQFQLDCLNHHLRVLSLRSNQIEQINGIIFCQQLIELYLGNNQLNDFKCILHLKKLPNLSILELSNNPLVDTINHYRYQVIYYLKSIKSLDNMEITSNELCQSKELFHGRLSCEYLMEYLEMDNFTNLVQLDLPKCMLRTIDCLDLCRLINLKSINLEKNYLTSFGGLVFLSNLKVICLNENNIEGLFSRGIYSLAMNVNFRRTTTDSMESRFVNLYRSTQPIYPCLSVLHLAQNGIRSLQEFQFHRMTCLQTLFLQDNDLITINGLEGLNHLKELVLDNNRIKVMNELSFLYNWTLKEIHLENNRLHELSHLSKLENLQRLYVGANKLTDFVDLEKFAQSQRNLFEISLIDNPIATRQIHRLILIHCIPKLQFIDGVEVTEEERLRIAQFYAERDLSDIMSYGVVIPQHSAPQPQSSAPASASAPAPSSISTCHYSGKVNNSNRGDIALPEITVKRSSICGVKINENTQLPTTHTLITNESKEYHTLFAFGKPIRQNLTQFNDCQLNKTKKLNNLTKPNNNSIIQFDSNEKHALTIRSIQHANNHLLVDRLRHHCPQSYMKQPYTSSTPDSRMLSINSLRRSHSRTGRIGHLKSFQHNYNSNNSNNSNNNNHYDSDSNIKTTMNMNINNNANNSNNNGPTDSFSSSSSNLSISNKFTKFSAMSTNYQR
ncbi:unnamed protein product [Schistosoma turkestanicum]|nr:unnamed protein product [Schistosoma turkestanicum]